MATGYNDVFRVMQQTAPPGLVPYSVKSMTDEAQGLYITGETAMSFLPAWHWLARDHKQAVIGGKYRRYPVAGSSRRAAWRYRSIDTLAMMVTVIITAVTHRADAPGTPQVRG